MVSENAMRAVWNARRKASAELVTALGYDPVDILDPHNGRLEWDDQHRLILHVIEYDERGNTIIDGDTVRTHVERVQITPERLAAYKAALAAAGPPP